MANKVYMTGEAFASENEALGANLPYASDLTILGDSFTLGSKAIPNRLVCQAMEGCDGTADGSPDELTIRRYHRFAKGGAGLIWFEATACLPEGRANPRQLWLTEANLDSYKRLLNDIREISLRENGYAPLIIMQNTHSGRYSKPEGKPAPIIAYNNPIFEKNAPIDPSRIITDEELERVGEALIHNSVLAEKAGFDGVDIKCCHRYLNSELLSAYEREGRYGGSYENRTRLLRESVEGSIAAVSGDFIVSSRLNVYDGFPYPYGFGVKNDGSLDFDPTEPTQLLKDLYALGVRLLNITMGNPYFNPHVNRPFAMGAYEAPEYPLLGVKRVLDGTALLKEAVPDMAIICSAVSYLGVAAPHVVAGYMAENKFDFGGFGRTIFAYPDFAKEILTRGEMDPKKICIACSKCTELMRSPGGTPGCVIRDPLYTKLYQEMKASQAKA